MSEQPPRDDAGRHDDDHDEQDEGRRRGPRLGVEDMARLLQMLMNLKPIGQETAERLVEAGFRVLNRREVLERIIRSDFMRHVRDMQSEITESIGIASQADVQDIKRRLDDVTDRLDRLQRTLDEIVVEVDEA